MKNNLVIVARNERAARESSYPRTWLVHRCDRSTVEVDVAHDDHGKPSVVGYSAASATACHPAPECTAIYFAQ